MASRASRAAAAAAAAAASPSTSSESESESDSDMELEQEEEQEPEPEPKLAPIPARIPAPMRVPEKPSDPSVAAFLSVLNGVSPADAGEALDRLGIAPLAEHVPPVLRGLYSSPAAAVKFFRWSGVRVRHSPSAWNAMVEVLGRNGLYEAMWDAVRSMKHEGALSLSTFSIIFETYASARRASETVMSFDVMERYDLTPDIAALNSLLSSLCLIAGSPAEAQKVLDRVNSSITPDRDTFALLLAGWERVGDATASKKAFGEMVVRLGWDPANVEAYDSFLCTLVNASQLEEAFKFIHVMSSKNCFPGNKFIMAASQSLITQNDTENMLLLWTTCLSNGITPYISLCDSLIKQLSRNNNITNALRVLDQMPLLGVFADAGAYNDIFECFIRMKRTREAEQFFVEMKKNEMPLTLANCATAIHFFFQEFNPISALEVWNYVLEQESKPSDDCVNALLLGLRDLGRVMEVCDHAEKLSDMGVKLDASMIESLRRGFYKAEKSDAYDRLLTRLGLH